MNTRYIFICIVSSLIFFLSTTSQVLFIYLPEPFTQLPSLCSSGILDVIFRRRVDPCKTIPRNSNHTREIIIFIILIASLWICYMRACFTVAAGVSRLHKPDTIPAGMSEVEIKQKLSGKLTTRDLIWLTQNWCKKCEWYKPSRAHHCRICGSCIIKMDHHCPWTGNCVSHTTLPHFMRFLFYSVLSMIHLGWQLYLRIRIIWDNRFWPIHLGPTNGQMFHLFTLVLLNTVTLFLVFITLVRSLFEIALNITTIESWEIDRHATLVRQARANGGYLCGVDGSPISISLQEFPYDIGIWNNLCQCMGSTNLLQWFWPFATTPSAESGMSFQTNGLQDPSIGWPPPDPIRMSKFTFKPLHATLVHKICNSKRGNALPFESTSLGDSSLTQVDSNTDDDVPLAVIRQNLAEKLSKHTKHKVH